MTIKSLIKKQTPMFIIETYFDSAHINNRSIQGHNDLKYLLIAIFIETQIDGLIRFVIIIKINFGY